MKKFLSSILATAMIAELAIVPVSLAYEETTVTDEKQEEIQVQEEVQGGGHEIQIQEPVESVLEEAQPQQAVVLSESESEPQDTMTYEEFRKAFFANTTAVDKDGFLNASSEISFYEAQGDVVEETMVYEEFYHQAPIEPELVEGPVTYEAYTPVSNDYGFGTDQTKQRQFYVTTTSAGGYTMQTANLVAQGENVNIWVVTPTGGYAGAYATYSTDSEKPLLIYDYDNVDRTNVEEEQKEELASLDASTSTIVATEWKAMTLAAKLDNIYEKVTYHVPHEGILVEANYSNVDEFGDTDNDGRVNVVMSDINQDGIDPDSTNKSSGYTAGLFYAMCYYTYKSSTDTSLTGNIPSDVVLMDIGLGQGFDSDTGDVVDGFYGTFAHELQHLLYYMYAGHYIPNEIDGVDYPDTWYNESLSGVPDQFYSDYTVSFEDWKKLSSYPQDLSTTRGLLAMNDDYTYNSGDNGSLTDWGNGSSKNYGMGYLLSAFMMNHDPKYFEKTYEYFESKLVAHSNTESGFTHTAYNHTTYNDKSMNEIIGEVFRYVLEDSVEGIENLAPETVFDYVYQAFMESYISGGGLVLDGNDSVSTDEIYTMYHGTMWGLKEDFIDPPTGNEAVSGSQVVYFYSSLDKNRIYTGPANYYTSLGKTEDSISTTAYREKTYVLDYTGYTTENNILKINIGDNANLKAYIALHDSTHVAYSSGLNTDYKLNNDNATLYPLEMGKENYIDLGEDTNVKPYLFVITFDEVDTVSVVYSYEASVEAQAQEPLVLEDTTIKLGETLDLGDITSGGSGTGEVTYTVASGEGTITDYELDGSNLTPKATGTINISATKAASAGYNEVSTTENAVITVEEDNTPPDVETVTITLEVNGGTLGAGISTTFSVEKNGTITESLPEPTKESHVFNGWYTATTDGEQITASTTFEQDSTIYAQWKAKPSEDTITVTVSFDESVVNSDLPQELQLSLQNIIGDLYLFADDSGLLKGEVLPKIEVEGYNFLGWYVLKSDIKVLTRSTEEYVLVDDDTVFSKDTNIYPSLVEKTENTVVTKVALNKSTTTIAVGDTETLRATIAPENATNTAVTWSSDDAAVATVDENGVVTAKAEGTATITAISTDDTNISASCEVTVVISVESITLSKDSTSLVVGATETLEATIAPTGATNKAVTWSTSDEKVATVETDGTVTAVAEGTATITVTTEDGGCTDTCVVTVTAAPVAVTGVTLEETATIPMGTTKALTATIAPDDATNKAVTWTSSTEAVATVDANGVVIAKAEGTATITATSTDGTNISASCEVTVASVTLNKNTLSLKLEATEQLTADIKPNDLANKNVTWSTSDEKVATVVGGLVTAVAEGTATITVTTEDGGCTDTCVVIVDGTLPVITLSGSNTSGSTVQIQMKNIADWEAITATAEDDVDKNLADVTVVYSSTDNANLTLAEVKTYLAEALGNTVTATYTVSDEAGNEATATLTLKSVENTLLDQTTLVFADATVYGHKTLVLETTGGSGSGEVTYAIASDDSAKATIATADGVVTFTPASDLTAKTTVSVTATKAADSDYKEATATATITIELDTAAPVITASYNTNNYTEAKTITILPSEVSGWTVSATATDLADGTVDVSIGYSSTDEGSAVTNLDSARTHLDTVGNTVLVTFTAEDTVGNEGTLLLTFTTGMIELTSEHISNISESYDYTGSAIEPIPVVEVNGTTLISGTDYTVTYSNNTDLSTESTKASITITGKGNYGGSVTLEFAIVPVSVSEIELDNNKIYLDLQTNTNKKLIATITPENATNKAVNWTSSADTIATVFDGAVTAVAVGTATITATSAENAEILATCTVTVTAEPVTLYTLTVTDGSGSGTYLAGDPVIITAFTPTTGYAFDKWTTTSNVTFADATASVTTFTMPAEDVTVVANYKTVTVITDAIVTVTPESYTVTGEAITPTLVTVVLNGKTLILDEDYTLSYSNNTTVGTATVTATGKGSYSGYATGSFDIVEAPPSPDPTVTKVTVNPSEVNIARGDNKTFTATVTGENNPAQTVTWTVTGNGSADTFIKDGILYVSADETSTYLIVTATSDVNKEKYGSATVTVSDVSDPDVGEEITITLDVNGGTLGTSSLTSCIISKGGTITQSLPVPTRDSHYFKGWYTAAIDGKQVTDSTTFDADSSIYAQWKTKPATATVTITVSLDTEVVSSLPTALQLTIQNLIGDLYLFADEDGLLSGESLPKLDIDGYIFRGWYVLESSVVARNSEYVLVEDDTIFSTDSTIYPYLIEDGTEEEEEEAGTEVTGVSISLRSLSITAGNTHTLSATVSPTTAENKTVKWSSSNTSVATVNYLGIVTAVSAGTAVITVKTVEGEFTASCTVYVESAGYTITLDTNGGTLSTKELHTNSKGYINSYPSPVRSNYTFNGWYTTRTGGTMVTTSTQYSYNQTIYAQWVTNSSGSTGGSGTAVGSYTNSTSYTQNGTVVISPLTADVGSTVYVSVSPNSGYEIGEVLATRISTGAILELSSYGNGNYSFEQPGGSVRVTATFDKIPTESVYSGLLTVPVIGTMLPSTFYDINSSAWYYSAVKFAYDRGLMSGTGNGDFSPDMNTSRGMIVQVLYNIAGKPVPFGMSFSDVGTYDYYADAVSWASGLGIVGGIGENQFAPYSEMTREQLVVMLYAFERTLGGASYLGDKTLPFTDSYAISSWAVDATVWCVAKGIVAGKPDNSFDPQASATRAEVAQILKNFVELYV